MIKTGNIAEESYSTMVGYFPFAEEAISSYPQFKTMTDKPVLKTCFAKP